MAQASALGSLGCHKDCPRPSHGPLPSLEEVANISSSPPHTQKPISPGVSTLFAGCQAASENLRLCQGTLHDLGPGLVKNKRILT